MKNRYEVSDGVAYVYDCNNECFMVDAGEITKIAHIRWRCRKGRHSYVVGNIGKKGKVYLHRFINHNTRDNRKINLRLCNNRENSINRVNQDNEGVSYRADKKRWRAYINVNYKQINLGNYKTEEEARIARRKAVKIFYGQGEVVLCPRKPE